MPEPGEKARRRAASERLGNSHEHERWKFCTLSPPEGAARAIEDARERDEEVDWWAAGEPRRRR